MNEDDHRKLSNSLYFPDRTTRFLNRNSIFRSDAGRERLEHPNWKLNRKLVFHGYPFIE